MSSKVDKSYEKIPTLITIFGATGDLSRKKLLPAFFDLYAQGVLPKTFKIVGFSRSERTDENFRRFAKRAIEKKGHRHSKKILHEFLGLVHYHSGFFDDLESFGLLGDHFLELDKKFGNCSNKLFYLAVPPAFYETILNNLANSGLTIPCSDKIGWTRVLLEKPFGEDIKKAEKLDKMLSLLFREEQIFRIDHYLAKETIQNILSFRFSNILFEPIWNKQYIEKVEMKLFETGGVEGRGTFYDGIGALRDVGQNHILQMLSVISMENPGTENADDIRVERARVLKALIPISKKCLKRYVARGQYRGYKNVKGVEKGSNTETYFRIKASINTPRWKGVPFYLEAGKKMKVRKAEINIFFKNTKNCLCSKKTHPHHQNILTFRIQPDEGISVLFWAKKPGLTTQLEEKKLSFRYKHTKALPADAYERVLFDSITGDQTLFTSTDEVNAAWKFITPILKNWECLPLEKYREGFSGSGII